MALLLRRLDLINFFGGQNFSEIGR